MKPYKEVLNNNSRTREFKVNTPNKELVWHRDEKDVIFIPKQTYHRVLKGKTNLVIKIEEND